MISHRKLPQSLTLEDDSGIDKELSAKLGEIRKKSGELYTRLLFQQQKRSSEPLLDKDLTKMDGGVRYIDKLY